MSQIPDSMIGRQFAGYRLTALIGVGGMAKVYRAQDLELGREVAMKLVSGPQASDAAYVERFRNEAVRIAALTHPNIVPIYQFGEDKGALFLVMPVVAESLRDRLDREHVLPFDQAVKVVTQMAAALQWAHSQGMVHRDVKPENILLDKADVALLTDFGIAREAEALRKKGAKRTLSPSGLPVGTPEYMAPEQLQAHTVDHRCDIYALGAVLYELITGTTPHAAATPYAVAVRVLTEPLTPPSQHNPQIPPQLEQVVLRALAMSPEDRYQDMASFAKALTSASIAPSVSQMATVAQPVSLAAPFAALREPQQGSPTEPSGWNIQVGIMPATIRRPSAFELSRWLGGSYRWLRTSNHWLIAAGLVALVVLSGTGILLVSHLPSSPNSSPGQSLSEAGTSTVSTASKTPSPGAGNGVASPQKTATAQASATARAVPTSTTGPGKPTPTSGPVSLNLNPAAQIVMAKQSHTCTGQQTITNNNAFAVSWQWTNISNISVQGSHLQFQLNGSGWISGLPSGTVSGNGSISLSIMLDCAGGQSDSVSMTDNLGNAYSFNLLD